MRHPFLAIFAAIVCSEVAFAQELPYGSSKESKEVPVGGNGPIIVDSGVSEADSQLPSLPGATVTPLGTPVISGTTSSPQSPGQETVTIEYLDNLPVFTPVTTSLNGVSVTQLAQTTPHQTVISKTIDVDCDLTTIDLPGDGNKVAIQAVTAIRHKRLLQKLKEATTDTEKQEAAKKLEENYRSHYASETDWRMKKIAEIEKRLEEMRSQVKAREASETKYVDAAVTLAKLYAEGIASEPPQLNSMYAVNRSASPSVVPAYSTSALGTSGSPVGVYPSFPTSSFSNAGQPSATFHQQALDYRAAGQVMPGQAPSKPAPLDRKKW